jgi:transposase
MTIVVLGIDLGKNSCSLAGLDESGRVVLTKRLKRSGVIAFVASLPPCAVAMEACCGAHYLARRLIELGYDVRLIAPQYVRPYVKRQKNDDRDAEAIAEAAMRPTMRFVTVKTEAQLDLQTLHRVRERLIDRRTALINQIRGILLERGIFLAKGKAQVVRALPELLADEKNGLSPRVRRLLHDLREEWRQLDERVGELDAEFMLMAHQDETTRRLLEMPGIGALTATALVAAIGKGEAFTCGRDLAAWLGLVPRQFTTGGKPRLLGISKRGNAYVRRLFIHGARAVLPRLATRKTPLGNWLRTMLERRHKNIVVVALANKLTRIAWAVVAGGVHYTEFTAAEAV